MRGGEEEEWVAGEGGRKREVRRVIKAVVEKGRLRIDRRGRR